MYVILSPAAKLLPLNEPCSMLAGAGQVAESRARMLNEIKKLHLRSMSSILRAWNFQPF